MRQYKTRIEMFSVYDHVGMATHFEKLASKGWMLESIGRWGFRYRRSEPQVFKFAVTYFPPASAFDPEPSEGEQTFREYCEQAGWQLAASNAQLQVFYNDTPNPIPLETDAALQVENIHAAAKKTVLFGNWILGIMGLLYSVFWLLALFGNPVVVMSDYNMWFRGFFYFNLLFLCVVELVTYYRWHNKAVQEAEETGRLYPTQSHRVYQTVELIVVLGSLAGWFLSMQSQRTRMLLATSLLCMAALIGLVQGCQALLKKLKVSKTKNKVITLTVDFVLAFLLIGIAPRFVMNMEFEDRKPVDTYYHYGINREVYNDPLPLTVEDLLEVNPDDYSKELNLRRTVLVSYYDAIQEPRKDREEDLPGFAYDLVIGAVPAWTGFLMEGWTDDYRADHPLVRHLETRDPEPWQAKEAFRVIYEDGEAGVWYVRWEDRFVRLDTSWELTEEQMGYVAEILLNCAE